MPLAEVVGVLEKLHADLLCLPPVVGAARRRDGVAGLDEPGRQEAAKGAEADDADGELVRLGGFRGGAGLVVEGEGGVEGARGSGAGGAAARKGSRGGRRQQCRRRREPMLFRGFALLRAARSPCRSNCCCS